MKHSVFGLCKAEKLIFHERFQTENSRRVVCAKFNFKYYFSLNRFMQRFTIRIPVPVTVLDFRLTEPKSESDGQTNRHRPRLVVSPHVLHSPPPPREQVCNRSCSNKNTRAQNSHLSGGKTCLYTRRLGNPWSHVTCFFAQNYNRDTAPVLSAVPNHNPAKI